MTELATYLATTTRARTILELPPQMSSTRMLVNGAAGQTDDGYVSLTISDDTAELLAQILIRYNSAVQGDGTEDPVELRAEPDHDVEFWDALACDLLVATHITPPKTTTAMVHSIGKTVD